ncbi:MAG: hypothetical protein MUE52_00365 [Tabrizicola sp.]|jgi:hypothetical protein|nr:hypothetical protein [Tabrizicola sp.]
MTTYRERQDESWSFDDGDKILKTFRGVGKKAIEAAKQFSREHWRIQKALADGTVYAGLRGDEVWTPVSEVLESLALDVRWNPRAYCSPPDIPDDWDTFRKVLLDYAPADWWHAALGLADLCKDSTWRSALSRSTKVRAFEDIRHRARDWRSRVMQGLDRWEVGVKEHDHWRSMVDFRVKDALDADGEEAAFAAFKHLRQFETTHARSKWSSNVSEFHYFDPAFPEGPQFSFFWSNEDVLRAEFQDLLASGFKMYRDGTRKPPTVTVERQWKEFASDDFRWEWQAMCEVERRGTWDSVMRSFDYEDRILRVRVKAAARHALPDEVPEVEYQRRYKKKGRAGREFEDRNDWEDESTEFVWRWRAFDPERDNLGGSVGRDFVMRLTGLNLENDDPVAYLKDRRQPVEDEGGYSVD